MNRQQNFAALLLLALILPGCTSVTKLATQAAQGSGVITEEQAESVNRSSEALEKTFEDITPEQEYFIGRAVAANILHNYTPVDNADANQYLNLLGQTLAMASDFPETFGGYHFLLLDSAEINAFAAPGGLILLTRGLLQCCKSEDALAAVLAHEIAHVQNKDGLRAIKRSRLTVALATVSVEAARNVGNERVQELASQFEAGIDDVVQTLVNKGYARSQEHAADADALILLRRVGYDPHALDAMLAEMDQRLAQGGPGFAKTHPSPEDRRIQIRGPLAGAPRNALAAARQERFVEAMRGL